MRQIILLLSCCLLLQIRGLCGGCPDRPLLREKIATLRSSTVSPDDQLKELLPYITGLETCPILQDSTFAILLQRIGALYFAKKDFTRAIIYTRRAVGLLKEKCPSDAAPYLVNWYHFLKIFYDSVHQKKESLASIDSAIAVGVRSGNMSFRVLFDHWQKTSYYYDVGDYDRCYSNALVGLSFARQYSRDKDSLQLVVGYWTVAFNALHELGRYDQEEELLKARITEFTAVPIIAVGPFLNQLGIVYREKGYYTQALDYMKRSYDFNERMHYSLGCSQSLNNSGWINLLHLKNYRQAISQFRQALTWLPAERAPNSSQALEALNEYDNIASVHMARGQLDSAFFYFQLAFDQLQPGMNENDLSAGPEGLEYSPEKAEYLPQLLIHKADAWYARYGSNHDPKSLQEAIHICKVADLFLQRIKTKQSEVKSQLAFRKNARQVYEHAIRASMAENSPEDAFYFFERSRAILLNDQLKKQMDLDDRTLAERGVIRKKILQLEKEIEITSPEKAAYAKLQTDLFSAKQELDRYDEQDHRKPDNAKSTSSFSTLPILHERLAKDSQSFLALYSGDSDVYSLMVSGTNTSLQVIDKNRFDSLAHVYTAYVSDPERLNRDMPGFVRTADLLYHLLFPAGNTPPGRLVVSPDGYYFPFESLITNNSVRHPLYFLEDHPVCYTYSARYFLDTPIDRSGTTGKEFMGIAPVQYASYLRLPDLPGSSGSLDQIASSFGSPDKFTEKEASKSSFLRNYSDYRLIQLYTHAVGNSSGKEPLIYFADSALALSELIPEKKPLTRIIVLSACETANGEFYQGEGVFSFNREFAALGIPTAVVNCWSVDNKATYQLTELFYKFLSQGLPADIALQQAKKEFIRSSSAGQRLPYYWAAPVLTGQATLLPQRPRNNRWLYLLLLPAALLITGYFLFRRTMRKKL